MNQRQESLQMSLVVWQMIYTHRTIIALSQWVHFHIHTIHICLGATLPSPQHLCHRMCEKAQNTCKVLPHFKWS